MQASPAASPRKPAVIHPTACVDQPCEVGDGTHIWHFTHVRQGARIGAGCNIGQNVYIGADVIIGDRCKIQNNVSVYEGIVLEDEVFLGPSAVFTNVINPRAAIERKHEIRPTRLLRGATVGANATVVCGVTIGRWAFIGAGAVITRSIPDFALVMGVPARQAGWVCRCGVRLATGGEIIQCAACGDRYRLIQGKKLLIPAEEYSSGPRPQL